ncbi:hypothetical protein CXF35_04160 [Corynebacterium bovis]|uniref:Uncharacterized protein n=1 Tax=Corynebacterium bovis TaxID=36808 RepID=A0A3R8QPU6_9CORY|nr:hypothetical protein CXF38_05490 [Corynebacterium bovis]RRO82932.1 hypothetical protein CXF36_04610 [Corynebacterium bovis]RRO84553.1 hypothetical protein CXF37_02920 [Corynebacterium bovis]RRO91637.1 hypothetical protein CXF40_05950 [Corynebacterium bovis]RRO92082.1 hypothetical protein CXF45_02085 [Corynebacterium bovis]
MVMSTLLPGYRTSEMCLSADSGRQSIHTSAVAGWSVLFAHVTVASWPPGLSLSQCAWPGGAS